MSAKGRSSLEERLNNRQRRYTDYYVRKAKEIIQEINDGHPHKVEIYRTEFYGNNRFITAPYSTMTLIIDGRRELGSNLSDASRKTVEFDWYGTVDGRPEKEVQS